MSPVGLLAGLLAYAAWALGLTRHGILSPTEIVPAAILGIAVVLAALVRPPRAPGEARTLARRRLVRQTVGDPLFAVGLALVGFLALQAWNSGRALVYEEHLARWTYGAPPHPGWPSSFNAAEAVQMLYWFGGAWLVALAVRHALTRANRIRLLWLLAANGALLALFGVAQYASGTASMFWRTPLTVYFFASFGYPNHAAAYFTLALAISLGFGLRGLGHRAPRAVWLAVVLATCNLAGATLSLSRAGVLLSWSMTLAAVAYALWRRWSGLSTARRLNAVAAIVALLACAGFLYFGARQNRIRERLATTTAERVAEVEVPVRWVQVEAGLRMWRDRPWFGVGGWGYRYLFPLYLPPGEAGSRSPGRANVHDDPVQFLVEFGLIGGGLVAAGAVLLFVPVARRFREAQRPWWRARPLPLALLAGVAATLLHSLFDLPFRSPPVLWLWVACVACVPSLLLPPNGALTLPRAAQSRKVNGSAPPESA